MKSIILITFIAGLLFFTVGYMKTQMDCTGHRVKRVSKKSKRNVYASKKLDKIYSNMFKEPSVWLTYPFNNLDLPKQLG